MKNCTNCKYDNNGGQCQQGHIRWNMDHHWIVENCHAWQEKEKCECYKFFDTNFVSGNLYLVFNLKCKKCGRIIE